MKDRDTLGLIVWLVIGAVILPWVLGCGQPPQTLQMVVDGNGHIRRAEWFWLDEAQDYCRLEAIRDPAWLRVGCRNGDVLAY